MSCKSVIDTHTAKYPRRLRRLLSLENIYNQAQWFIPWFQWNYSWEQVICSVVINKLKFSLLFTPTLTPLHTVKEVWKKKAWEHDFLSYFFLKDVFCAIKSALQKKCHQPSRINKSVNPCVPTSFISSCVLWQFPKTACI